MIEKYKWSQSISTGDPAIDVQHKQFFFVLHDFAETLEQGRGAQELKKMLVFLKYYGEWHFGKEEQSLACFNCPMACDNNHAHEQFIETINTLLEQIRYSGTSEFLAHDAYEKLSSWLVNHIMKIDVVNSQHVQSTQQ
ncbi:MAG: hemerythrin family protein [Cocleimonas sp.]|nr:hemerythrin family protein [Cocleimonas sp.]